MFVSGSAHASCSEPHFATPISNRSAKLGEVPGNALTPGTHMDDFPELPGAM